MITFPWSIGGYALVGMIGAATFLFLLLLFDKKVAILENGMVSTGAMVALYIAFGGVLAVIINLAVSPDFGVSQLTIAFGTGLSWPAIAAGIGAGKRVGELNDDKQQIRQLSQEVASETTQEIKDYYEGRNTQARDSFELARTAFEAEIERIRDYYSDKIAALGGG